MRRRELWCQAVFLAGLLSGATAASGDRNLLKNGDFTAEAGGRPTDWTIRDSGQGVSLDNRTPCNVRVTGSSYVILRGLNLTGGQCHGIVLGDGEDDNVHNVIIENCDISNWGSDDQTGFGINHHSGVYSNSSKLQRVVIQRNRIHNPRSNANCWKEDHGGTFHPLGPQAISFMRGRGSTSSATTNCSAILPTTSTTAWEQTGTSATMAIPTATATFTATTLPTAGMTAWRSKAPT